MDKDEETFRFLFLGPSFTFGWANNYEDTYVSIIAENVVVKGKDIEIMNLGTPAQPIGYQLCWLQEIGYKFNPDFIVQTVYGGKSNLVIFQVASNRSYSTRPPWKMDIRIVPKLPLEEDWFICWNNPELCFMDGCSIYP